MRGLTDKTLFEDIVTQRGKSLILFSAHYCHACGPIEALLDSIAQDYPDVTFGKVDVEIGKRAARVYQIRALPTLLLFVDGRVISQLTGSVSKYAIQEMLDA